MGRLVIRYKKMPHYENNFYKINFWYSCSLDLSKQNIKSPLRLERSLTCQRELNIYFNIFLRLSVQLGLIHEKWSYTRLIYIKFPINKVHFISFVEVIVSSKIQSELKNTQILVFTWSSRF